jgi:hypothetical protein
MTLPTDERQAAINRIEARRAFDMHATFYGVVNLLLVLIWALTGRGDFWPIWPILGWGVGLALHYWAVNGRTPIAEDEIRREMDRGG